MVQAQLVVQNIGGVVVVNFGNNAMLDSQTIEAVGKQLYELVEAQAHRKLVLDFSGVRFLSSGVLGVLVKLQKLSTLIKGRVVICGMRDEHRRIFAITHLDRIFTFYKTEQEALASFDPFAPN